MCELKDIFPDLSALDQPLDTTQDVPSEDGLFPSSVLDELCYLADAHHQPDFSSLLDLNDSQQLCQPDNVLPYSLSYCTPPYSPSSTVPTAEEPCKGLCTAAVIPVDTTTTMGSASQMAVKTEAPSSSDMACAQKQWMSHLFVSPEITHELNSNSGSVSTVPSMCAPKGAPAKMAQGCLPQPMTFCSTPQVPKLEMLQATLKRQERLRKNRESSCVSRKKRKMYLETLEDRLKEAAAKNAALMAENDVLRKKLATLDNENKRLQTLVTRENDKPSQTGKGGFATMVIVLLLGFSLGCVSFQSTAWKVTPISQASFPVESTAVGPLHTHRRLLALDDSKEITTNQQSLPSSKALAVRRTELATASLHMSENAITSATVAVKEAERRSLTRDLRRCFDLWERKKQGQETYSVSSAVIIDSCKKLLSQLESNPNLDLGMMSALLLGCRHCRSTHDADVLGSQRSLESFLRGFKRDMERYYIVSFKDHVLLSAPERNHSAVAKMSVIVPSANTTAPRSHPGIPLVQIDCTVDALTYFQWDGYS